MAEEKEEPKIGIYVCHCGINIKNTVDVDAVRDYAATLPNVVLAKDYMYVCSDPGQEIIRQDIRDGKVNRVIVAACSPRLHEPTFRNTCVSEGLNPFFYDMANIREQCSWVWEDKERNTEKAKDIVRSTVARSNLLEPLEEKEVDVVPEALVIGGGIAGMYGALDIANAGYKVHLVERTPTIGGHMLQFDKTFPTLDCAACILTPRMVDVGKHPNIDLLSYSEVEEVGGSIGNFTVKVNKKPRYIHEKDWEYGSLCTGCSLCADACRMKKIPNEFDLGLGKRSAAYLPMPQAVPAVYTIDPEKCIMLTKGKCGKATLESTSEAIKKIGRGEVTVEEVEDQIPPCVATCGPKSIDFDMKDETVELNVGTIIVATGTDVIDPTLQPEYKYGVYPNVIHGLEMERLLAPNGPTQGKVIINDKEPKDIVFIQCAGSRNKQTGYEYCSRVCCMYSIKHAHLIKERIHDANISILYQDIRAFGKAFEEFYDRIKSEGVNFRRGLASEVYQKPGSDRMVVRGEDTMLGEPYELEADLVVLASGLRPSDGVEEIVRLTKLSQSADKFFLEAHPKLRPVDTAVDGMFVAGCCQGPKDIPDSVAQAKAASSASLIYLGTGKAKLEAITSEINEDICTGCRTCEALCPYGALEYDSEEKIMRVNDAICKGCGCCSGACPSGAASMRHFRDIQVYAQIEALTEALAASS
ncbi:MAG: CoB--CoM heterodisulfide reductase iron-sulfur subunit A family protein [Desulfobacterales bacterium]|nr:CoB--CoM heterodisulfide reductase iron-sulfur subunit A family protein [Desulfobacterales bacterium]